MQDHLYTKAIYIAKISTIIVSALAILLALFLYQSQDRPERSIVAITQIAQHPSLDQIRQGIMDELKEQGFSSNNIKIIYENAQGNITIATQIAQKFVGMNPEVVVGITTPSAQALHSALRGKDIPLVFSAVTDPIGASLVKDLDHTEENITGTIDLPPIRQQLNLIKKVVPGVKKIGVIYNPGEINSIRQIDKLENFARKESIEIIKSPAFKSSEVSSAASRLVGQVDAFYLPNDNTVIAAVEAVIEVSKNHNIPTLASDDQSVKNGILMSLANNQYQVGRDTGKLVARILHGEPATKIPVQISNKPAIMISEVMAKKMKLNISGITLDDLMTQDTGGQKH